ncbi:hypothetical protein JRO89_XS08G0123100 [Xanthoceras sorbifolium]|uniref:Uncharacterized protein n=1 Tax=Xanthoceras sorbifolium TaxID=99658 RepID=A0ABQ8HPG7_9ROSI|nr:hypothetical protein JRO89_XS08G0123100 [Xanthoceras sorbifolium]
MILMRCGALHLTFIGFPLWEPASRHFCAINLSGRRLVVGGPAELSEKGSLVCDGYKNGGEVNSTRRHSGMDVDPSGRDNHSDPRREFDIRKCFHTIDRHRLIPIFKEEIDIQKVFSAGRLVGGEKGPYSVPYSVLLSALPSNIYLHKLDQEIGRIRQKYEISIVQRIRSVLLRTGRIDDQEKENSGEEASFNAPQDSRAIIVGSIQCKAAFHSLVSL